MINSSHTHNSKRTPVHCPTHKHYNGKHVLCTEIGFNACGEPGIFTWCKVGHDNYFLSLAQIIKTLEEMREDSMIEGTQATERGSNEKRGRDNV